MKVSSPSIREFYSKLIDTCKTNKATAVYATSDFAVVVGDLCGFDETARIFGVEIAHKRAGGYCPLTRIIDSDEIRDYVDNPEKQLLWKKVSCVEA